MTAYGNHLPNSRSLNSHGRGVALINMPFSNLHCPSLPVGLLKAILLEKDIPCDDFYLNLDFAAYLGVPQTEVILGLDQFLAGDFVFSAELYGARIDETTYFDYIKAKRREPAENLERIVQVLNHVRGEAAPSFLDLMLDSYDWGAYEIIGFTSTFQQHAASLAFARRLAVRFPEVPIVLGGANVCGEMGLAWLDYAGYIDYVCTGEGDTALPQLVQALRGEADLTAIPNIAHRKDGVLISGPARAAEVKLENLPFPDYGSYYRRTSESSLREDLPWDKQSVLIEGSRGCWWGQKVHCVFCGLNNLSMDYRSKSPERVYEEMKALSARHHAVSFQAVDNILDRRYINTLFRWLDEDGSDLRLFFEVKSNMTLDELRVLRRGGMVGMQPGIESLSTEVLRLMGKGVTGIQNVFLLKWARYFGISVAWGLLCGFFGEIEEYYRQQLEWIPLLVHLQPPQERAKITLERYSPMHDHPDRFGVSNIREHFLYRSVYPDPDLDIMKIAYFFDYDMESPVKQATFDKLDCAIETWKDAYEKGASLSYSWSPGGFLVVDDRRASDTQVRYYYQSPIAEIYELVSGTIMSAEAVRKEMESQHGACLAPGFVGSALERFVERGIALREGKRYLALAVPTSRRFFDRRNCVPDIDAQADREVAGDMHLIGLG